MLSQHPLLTGTFTSTITSGVATFSDVTVNHNGNGRVTAVTTGLPRVWSDIFKSV
jgi:hypothetical protein